MRKIRLRTKLTLFNLLSKVAFAAVFIALLPVIVGRINTLQTDLELIEKREQVIMLIEDIGIDPFITSDSTNTFGSYNILKEEFISLEKTSITEEWNFIEVSSRLIEDAIIDYRVLNYTFKIDNNTYLLEIGKSLETIKHTEKNTRKVIQNFLILFILVTLLLDFYYTHRLLQPLKQIIEKLKNTSSPALFNRTPVKSSTSDFVQLDQTIRNLMDKIDELFRKEKETTVNISHELLTPISIIRSKLENLLQSEIDNDPAEKIEESLRTLNRLTTLVNSMLLISRIENRQYLKEDSFSLNDLLTEVEEEISPVATSKGISICRDLTNDFTVLKANRPLLFSMFFNIVNNAVKNSDSDKEIRISCFTHKGIQKVMISDNGRGMTKEQMATLFSRFQTRPKTDKEGTGIGLAITKSIADFHNIDISVESSQNNGTTFLFSFPEIS